MKRGAVAVGLLLIALGIMGFTGETPSFQAHDRIIISGDKDFTAENGVTSGSGTEEDPYIIEGWEIDAQNGLGIYIANTKVHFRIRNCKIYGAGTRPYYAGVILVQVENGTIESCEISSNKGDGIWLMTSSNIRIQRNWIQQNRDFGILLDGATGVMIEGNTIRGNQSGIGLGLYKAASENRIQLNYIGGNSLIGLALLKGSSGNIVRDNWIESSYIGIWAWQASTNEITANLVLGNGTYGVRFGDSSDNRIYHNNLIGNKYNGFDKGQDYWDDGACGNYWDDYKIKYPDAVSTGDTCDTWNIPYKVMGGDNIDGHPLVRPMVCLKRAYGEPGVKPCSS